MEITPARPTHLGLSPPVLLHTQYAYAVQGVTCEMVNTLHWTGRLTHEGRDVAEIRSVDDDVDVAFQNSEAEVHFLRAIETLRATVGTSADFLSVEMAVMELALVTIAEHTPDVVVGRTVDGQWTATHHPELQQGDADLPVDVVSNLCTCGITQVYARGHGWRDLTPPAEFLSSAPPLPLLEACQQAMAWHGVNAGDSVDFLGQQQRAMAELGSSARLTLEYPEPEFPVAEGACLMLVTTLLAALGALLPTAAGGRFGTDTWTALRDALDVVAPGGEATLTALAQPRQDQDDEILLLRALVTLQTMTRTPEWTTPEERLLAQASVLIVLINLLQFIEHCQIQDANAAVTALLQHPRLRSPIEA